MTGTEKITELKQTIVNTLTPLIDNDYVYLELPYYSNIGDSLIWQGTEDYLKSIPFKCLYRCSSTTFEYKPLNSDVVILLQGGGNFGDLYYHINIFRNKIIETYPNNRIIILPQTVYYKGFKGVQRDLKILRKHTNLYICARDKYSYNFLKRFNFSQNILLLPDMAFCIEPSTLRQHTVPSAEKTLVFKRVDKEKTDLTVFEQTFGNNCDYSDWPLYEQFDERFEKLKVCMKEKRYEEANKYAISTYLPLRVADGIRFISQYSTVFSNRLHGAILSILLEKEVTIIDNSYGKNAQFYDTWLKDVPTVHLQRVKHRFNLKRKVKMIGAWLLTR